MSTEETSKVEDSVEDLGEGLEETAKRFPDLLIKGLLIFGGLAGGRLASELFPKIWIFGKKTIGNSVLALITGTASVLSRNKSPKVSESLTFFTLGEGAGLVESLIDDGKKALTGESTEEKEGTTKNPLQILQRVMGSFNE